MCVCVHARARARMFDKIIQRNDSDTRSDPDNITTRQTEKLSLLERESRIKTDTQVANCVGKFDVRAINSRFID